MKGSERKQHSVGGAQPDQYENILFERWDAMHGFIRARLICSLDLASGHVI